MSIQDREHLQVATAFELFNWLEENSAKTSGLWVVTHKKSSGKPAPSYDEIVRTALSFGWIDSVPGKVDDLRSKLYISPRKAKSAWSLANKERVEQLIATGRMQPKGLAVVEAAKASGAWSLIDLAQKVEIPDDLVKAFETLPKSRENFEAFPRGVRKQILEWISIAKTNETRQRRIQETANLAQQNLRANQWRDKNPTK